MAGSARGMTGGGAHREPMLLMGDGGRSKAGLLNEDVVDASWTECGQCGPVCTTAFWLFCDDAWRHTNA